MATTYTEARATLNEIAERINNARKRAAQGRAQYAAAQSELAGLASAYATFITSINAAAAGSSWPQAAEQKAAKDQMVIEFQALKSTIDATLVAIDSV